MHKSYKQQGTTDNHEQKQPLKAPNSDEQANIILMDNIKFEMDRPSPPNPPKRAYPVLTNEYLNIPHYQTPRASL